MPLRTLSEDTEGLLMSYPWPGNVRELKNVLERTVLLTDGPEIESTDLSIERRFRQSEADQTSPIEISKTGLIHISFPPWGIPLENLEQQVIKAALEYTVGNISQAARLLHISRYALRYRMQKHEIEFAQE